MIIADEYIFYADIYFVQNVLVKAIVLYLTLWVKKIGAKNSKWKIPLVACIGTMFELFGLMITPNYNLFLAFVHLVEIPIMMWFLIEKNRKILVRCIITGYFFVIVVNGVIEILYGIFGQIWNYFVLILLSGAIIWLGANYFLQQIKISKGLFPIELEHRKEKLSLIGYYDSGNRLKDPYTGKGVHIVSNDELRKLPIEWERKVCIPYESLGNTDGLIEVYYIDFVKIHGQSKVIEMEKVPVAVADEKLFLGKRYQAIINEEVW